jgi:hypothetical protein
MLASGKVSVTLSLSLSLSLSYDLSAFEIWGCHDLGDFGGPNFLGHFGCHELSNPLIPNKGREKVQNVLV